MKGYLTPQVHPVELPPKCTFYVDPDLSQGCNKLVDWAGVYGINRPRDNLIKSPAMNTDSNSDGIVDNFSFNVDSGVITTATSLDPTEQCQRINITASTGITSCYVLQSLVCAPNEVLSFSVNGKLSDYTKVGMRLLAVFYNGSTVLRATDLTNNANTNDWQILKLENIVAPTTTTSVTIRFTLYPKAIGNTGTVYFKTALCVKGTTALQIADPHQKLSIIDKEIAGPYGAVRSLNGSADYFYCNNHSNIDITVATPENPLTVGCIVMVPLSTPNGYVICKNNVGSADAQYAIQYEASTKRFAFYLDGTIRARTLSYSVIEDSWCFVMFSWDGSTVNAYFNAILVSTTSFSGILPSRPYFFIGCRGNTNVFFRGLVGIQFITQSLPLDVLNWAPQVKLLQRYNVVV